MSLLSRFIAAVIGYGNENGLVCVMHLAINYVDCHVISSYS
jgi:hypothetical protein